MLRTPFFVAGSSPAVIDVVPTPGDHKCAPPTPVTSHDHDCAAMTPKRRYNAVMELRRLVLSIAFSLITACSCDPAGGSRVDAGSGDSGLADGDLDDGDLPEGGSCRPNQRLRYG